MKKQSERTACERPDRRRHHGSGRHHGKRGHDRAGAGHAPFQKNISGAPVVDDQKRVVGIVSESDLVSLDADIHFPHYIQFLDSVIFLESVKKFEERLRKTAATRIGQIMTTDVVTVQKDTPLHEVATMMTDMGVNRLPVLDGDVLAGIVTRASLVRSMTKR
ncbi:MAG: CBS domain-containing protein [Actinomycetota bacterium]